jgi:hypothetical protein
LYWKKLKSISHWQVVEFDAQVFLTKIVKATEVVGGTKTGECEEITDQVGLIKIPVLQRELSPIGGGTPVHRRQDPLKPLNAIEKLRFQAHLETEHVNKSTGAKTGVSSQLPNHRA